ncbi:MAG: hypothetical protein WDN46_00850 [Methylocella sp.]
MPIDAQTPNGSIARRYYAPGMSPLVQLAASDPSGVTPSAFAPSSATPSALGAPAPQPSAPQGSPSQPAAPATVDPYASFSSIVGKPAADDPYASFSSIVPQQAPPVVDETVPNPDDASDGPTRDLGADLSSVATGAANVLREANQGASLGLSPRIAAGFSALTGVGGNFGDYSGNLEAERAKSAAFEKEHPLVASAANAAGATATGIALPLGPIEAAAQGAGALGKAAIGAGVGGTLGGVQGAVSSPDYTNLPQVLSDASRGAGMGEIFGGALPLAASAGSKVITPFRTPDALAPAIATLDAENIPMTAGQRTGNKNLQRVESAAAQIPGAGGSAAINDRTGLAFTRAVLQRAGINAPLATDDVLDNGFVNLGDVFNDLLARNTVAADPQLATDLQTTLGNYERTTAPSQRTADVGSIVDDLLNRTGSGALPGDVYQATRSRAGNMADSVRMSDPQLSTAYRGIRDALDDAATRSISPDDAQAWQDARRQWGNLKDIATAKAGGGERGAQGYISPAQIKGAVSKGNNRIDYARGRGDFAELAKAGQAALTPLPDSGTAGRAFAMHLLSGGLGAGGLAAGGPVGVAAGLAAPAAIGRLILSRPIQAYLGNQWLQHGFNPPTAGSAIAALLGAKREALAQPAQQFRASAPGSSVGVLLAGR